MSGLIVIGLGLISYGLSMIGTELNRIAKALEYSNKLTCDDWDDEYRMTIMKRRNRKV